MIFRARLVWASHVTEKKTEHPKDASDRVGPLKVSPTLRLITALLSSSSYLYLFRGKKPLQMWP